MRGGGAWSASAWGYGVAVALTGLAFVLSLAFHPALAWVPSILFVLTVLASAWLGGLGPGLLASGLSTLVFDYLFVPPTFSLGAGPPPSVIAVIVFLLIQIIVACITTLVRQDMVRRDRAHDELRRLTAELESRARLAEARLQELNALHDASQAILSEDDPARLADQLLAHAVRMGSYDLGMLRLAREDGPLEVVAHRGYRDLANVPPPVPNPADVYSVFTSRVPKPVEDIRGDPAFPRLQLEGIESVIVCPIVAHGEALGILTLGTRSHHRFEPPEIKLLEAVAAQAGIALQKTRLHAATARANAELVGSLSLLEATLDSTADGILVVDTGGAIVRFNQRFVDMWRIPASIIATGGDHEALEFVRDQLVDPDGFLARVDELYRSPDAESFDVLEFKDGRVFERYSHPQRIDGRTVGRVWSFRDVSQRRRIEQHLLRAQRLETAGRIAGQVAHDFNNLLSPLVGFSELIKLQVPDNPRAQHYCDLMIQAAEQMAQINEDLLTMGRRGHFEQEPVDLNQIVREALAHLGPAPPTLTLDVQLPGDLLPVHGAPAQLVRMISNLVSNACEAMGGDGTLTLRTSNVYLDRPTGRMVQVPVGEYVRLDVVDTGPGIPPEIQDRIFDAFFTTRPAERRRGAGLGLSVVQGVVDDHRGYIDVDSTVGAGSTFSVYLPITRARAAGPRESSPVVGGFESILVVDDDPFQRAVATELLASLGYAVAVASSGEEALDALTSRPADLVVLDMVMPPGMDGTDTFRAIKARNPAQRAILLSGFAQSERVRVAQELGAGAFLHKPITREALAAAVRAELDGAGSAECDG